MRRDFCTILNLPFLLRGIALHRSLARVTPELSMHVACMDEESELLLKRLDLPGLTTISERELWQYDPTLAELSASRPVADYCKSVKPALCLYLLERGSDLITFLDADLMFFSDPEPMFTELGQDSILLMPMRRGPRLREEKDEKFGRYNSGTISFRNDETGLSALGWWREKCLEGRRDDNPLMDQPFIKDWPERFPGVHPVEHLGCGLAPWNAFQYELEPGDGEGAPLVNGVQVVFYHYFGFTPFHSVNAFQRTGFLAEPRLFTEGPLSLSWERRMIDGAAAGEDELCWIPYVREIAGALADVRQIDPGFTAGLVDARPPGLESEGVRPPAAGGQEASDGAVAFPAIRASARMLEPVWRHPAKDERSRVRVSDQGDLQVEVGLPGSEWFYLFHGETGFKDPPNDPELWAVGPDTFYELRFEAGIEGDAAVSLFAIEYDDERRIGHQRTSVEDGPNVLRLTTTDRTQSLRIAIRFSGSGTVQLSPLLLSEPLAETDEAPSQGVARSGRAQSSAVTETDVGERRPSKGPPPPSEGRPRRSDGPARLAVYGEIDMNLIDGSSVWLQSVAQVLASIPDTEVTVLLRRPDERSVLTAPLRDAEHIELVEPPAGARLDAAGAVDALERLDSERGFDLVLLRGREVSELACERGGFAGRLWAYHVPSHGRLPEADVEHLRRLGDGATRIACQTEAIRALVKAAIPEQVDKLMLLPPMIPASSPPPQADQNGKPSLFYAGKIAPQYYFMEMVQILERLRRSYPEAELHVVGDKIHNPADDPGFKPAAEAALAETDGLVWHGGATRDRVKELLAEADVALSIRDPIMDNELATKVLEYGSMGRAVLLNRTPIYEQHLGTDYPLFATDPGEAVKAISMLADDPGLRAVAVERCERAARGYTFERVAALVQPELRATIQGARLR